MKIFRFTYFMKKPPYWKNSNYGVVDVVVNGLSDIEDLMGARKGQSIHDVYLKRLCKEDDVIDESLNLRRNVWSERCAVFATKGKSRQVCIGICNFYEGDGKGDS